MTISERRSLAFFPSWTSRLPMLLTLTLGAATASPAGAMASPPAESSSPEPIACEASFASLPGLEASASPMSRDVAQPDPFARRALFDDALDAPEPSDDLGAEPAPSALATPLDPPQGILSPARHPELDDSARADKPYWRSNIFKRVLRDQKFLVTQWWPSEIKRWGFTGPLLASGLVAAGSSDDENAIDFRTEQTIHNGSGSSGGRTTRIAQDFTRLGNGAPASAMLGLTYLLARRAGNDRLAEASSISFEALLSTGLWVEILKEATARQRPIDGSTGKFFQYGKPESSSFPSGHSMGAFTIATVFAHVYADKKWMPWVAYGTAGLIGASRVALGRHYPSDVIAGAILGNSVGRMALARDGRESGAFAPGRFQPIFDPKHRAVGIGYNYSW